MEDQGAKKILFNKSMLFSLKAELLRKQEEVLVKKQMPQHKAENFKPPPVKTDKSEKSDKKSFKENLKAVDVEELQASRKSKLALEKKAELYEHLTDNAGNSQLAGRFLVDFSTKKQQQQEFTKTIVENKSGDEQVVANDNDDKDENEWVEFTDCLGRTRKCHKSDLEMFTTRDKALRRTMGIDTNTEDHSTNEDTNQSTEKPYLVQKTNDYLQSLRRKWEEKEKDLLQKDKDIHYQDLLFDEARIHGVGYYSFSTDETERRKQMEELTKRRQDTLKKQEEAEEMRKKRDELMAARVAAARARQRARAGLPPEPPQENQKDFSACLLELLTRQRNEVEEKAKAEENKIKEEQEKERQKLREAYIREWDLGKEGVEDKVKKFREMTQEEYVEQQRNKRINEFAPPQISEKKSSFVFDSKGRKVNSEEPATQNKTWSDVRPKINTPPPPHIGEISLDESSSPTLIEESNSKKRKGLYFSSKETRFNYRNFVPQQDLTPIVNELSDDESNTALETKNTGNVPSHSEIAPPATYEYYGPVNKKRIIERPFKSDIREAYAQGSKYLEASNSNRESNIPKQYDFMFN